jgi:hypothetical protein
MNEINLGFFRGTDDTIFNFRRLPTSISELENVYDPLTDRIVRGDCVVYDKCPVYLHGGSAFLCSRAAASHIARNRDPFLEMWNMAEDTTFGPFLDVIGIGVRNSCSGGFMDHGAASFSIRTVNDPRKSMGQCSPRNLSRAPILRSGDRVMDLLIYHKKDNAGKKMRLTLRRAATIFSAHESVRWFTEDDFGRNHVRMIRKHECNRLYIICETVIRFHPGAFLQNVSATGICRL